MAQTRLLIVVGAPGTDEYKEQFQSWAEGWQSAGEKGQCQTQTIGGGETVTDGDAKNSTDMDRLESAFSKLAETDEDAWIVLIGHGTFDGKSSKFNLNGPDVLAMQMKNWLDQRDAYIKKTMMANDKNAQDDDTAKAQRVPRTMIINCASASGPFINKLGGKNRIVVTATKSGYQFNFARFGKFMSEAINDPSVDLDKDQQTSLLEAFLAASRETQLFYESEGRLATEFALLDDNGDGKATPAEWFQGTRAVRRAKDGTPADGLRSNQVFLIRNDDELKLSDEQLALRDQLEASLEELRERKKAMSPRSYYQTVEPILIQLARLYAEAETKK